MNSCRYIKIVVVLMACLMVSTGPVLAGGIKERMKERLPVIAELKSQGVIGENNKGYLEFVSEKRQKEEVIEAENKDRKKVYKYFAKQQNTTLEVVEQVQAERKAKKANSGEFYQDKKGKWVKK